jgi:hypothetical protein
VVDVTSVRLLLAVLAGWVNHPQAEVLAYVVKENRTHGFSSAAGGST